MKSTELTTKWFMLSMIPSRDAAQASAAAIANAMETADAFKSAAETELGNATLIAAELQASGISISGLGTTETQLRGFLDDLDTQIDGIFAEIIGSGTYSGNTLSELAANIEKEFSDLPELSHIHRPGNIHDPVNTYTYEALLISYTATAKRRVWSKVDYDYNSRWPSELDKSNERQHPPEHSFTAWPGWVTARIKGYDAGDFRIRMPSAEPPVLSWDWSGRDFVGTDGDIETAFRDAVVGSSSSSNNLEEEIEQHIKNLVLSSSQAISAVYGTIADVSNAAMAIGESVEMAWIAQHEAGKAERALNAVPASIRGDSESPYSSHVEALEQHVGDAGNAADAAVAHANATIGDINSGQWPTGFAAAIGDQKTDVIADTVRWTGEQGWKDSALSDVSIFFAQPIQDYTARWTTDGAATSTAASASALAAAVSSATMFADHAENISDKIAAMAGLAVQGTYQVPATAGFDRTTVWPLAVAHEAAMAAREYEQDTRTSSGSDIVGIADARILREAAEDAESAVRDAWASALTARRAELLAFAVATWHSAEAAHVAAEMADRSVEAMQEAFEASLLETITTDGDDRTGLFHENYIDIIEKYPKALDSGDYEIHETTTGRSFEHADGERVDGAVDTDLGFIMRQYHDNVWLHVTINKALNSIRGSPMGPPNPIHDTPWQNPQAQDIGVRMYPYQDPPILLHEGFDHAPKSFKDIAHLDEKTYKDEMYKGYNGQTWNRHGGGGGKELTERAKHLADKLYVLPKSSSGGGGLPHDVNEYGVSARVIGVAARALLDKAADNAVGLGVDGAVPDKDEAARAVGLAVAIADSVDVDVPHTAVADGIVDNKDLNLSQAQFQTSECHEALAMLWLWSKTLEILQGIDPLCRRAIDEDAYRLMQHRRLKLPGTSGPGTSGEELQLCVPNEREDANGNIVPVPNTKGWLGPLDYKANTYEYDMCEDADGVWLASSRCSVLYVNTDHADDTASAGNVRNWRVRPDVSKAGQVALALGAAAGLHLPPNDLRRTLVQADDAVRTAHWLAPCYTGAPNDDGYIDYTLTQYRDPDSRPEWLKKKQEPITTGVETTLQTLDSLFAPVGEWWESVTSGLLGTPSGPVTAPTASPQPPSSSQPPSLGDRQYAEYLRLRARLNALLLGSTAGGTGADRDLKHILPLASEELPKVILWPRCQPDDSASADASPLTLAGATCRWNWPKCSPPRDLRFGSLLWYTGVVDPSEAMPVVGVALDTRMIDWETEKTIDIYDESGMSAASGAAVVAPPQKKPIKDALVNLYKVYALCRHRQLNLGRNCHRNALYERHQGRDEIVYEGGKPKVLSLDSTELPYLNTLSGLDDWGYVSPITQGTVGIFDAGGSSGLLYDYRDENGKLLPNDRLGTVGKPDGSGANRTSWITHGAPCHWLWLLFGDARSSGSASNPNRSAAAAEPPPRKPSRCWRYSGTAFARTRRGAERNSEAIWKIFWVPQRHPRHR